MTYSLTRNRLVHVLWRFRGGWPLPWTGDRFRRTWLPPAVALRDSDSAYSGSAIPLPVGGLASLVSAIKKTLYRTIVFAADDNAKVIHQDVTSNKTKRIEWERGHLGSLLFFPLSVFLPNIVYWSSCGTLSLLHTLGGVCAYTRERERERDGARTLCTASSRAEVFHLKSNDTVPGTTPQEQLSHWFSLSLAYTEAYTHCKLSDRSGHTKHAAAGGRTYKKL